MWNFKYWESLHYPDKSRCPFHHIGKSKFQMDKDLTVKSKNFKSSENEWENILGAVGMDD